MSSIIRQSLPPIAPRRRSSLRDTSQGELINHPRSISPTRNENIGRKDSSNSGESSIQSHRSGGTSIRIGSNSVQTKSTDPFPSYRRNILPQLIDDQSFLRSTTDLDRELSSFSSRSLEIFPSRELISEELRMRTVSLPTLQDRRHKEDVVARSLVRHYREHEDLSDSYTDDDSSDEGTPLVEIGPFPNVETDSYLDSNLLPEFLPPYLKPWTPGIRKTKPKRNYRIEAEKKRRELEASETKERKQRAQTKPRQPRRRSVRNDAFARKRESEAAKRHPVRKQFVYSELVQVELQKLTPKRLPGGKLKPIYDRRTREGDIEIPTNLHISLDSLSSKPGDDKIDYSDSPAAINKRRKEELQAMLERRKKIQRQIVHKKKRKVHFSIPSENQRDESKTANKVSVVAQHENGSDSANQGPNNEESFEENCKQIKGSNSDSDDGNIADVIIADRFVEGQELRISRTNIWVNDQHSPQDVSSHVTRAVEGDNIDLITDRNPSGDPDQLSNSNLDLSSREMSNPYLGMTSNTESSIEMGPRLEPISTQGEDRAQMVEDSQPKSKYRVNGEEGSLISPVGSGTVHEVRFLSERIPSIIISDT